MTPAMSDTNVFAAFCSKQAASGRDFETDGKLLTSRNGLVAMWSDPTRIGINPGVWQGDSNKIQAFLKFWGCYFHIGVYTMQTKVRTAQIHNEVGIFWRWEDGTPCMATAKDVKPGDLVLATIGPDSVGLGEVDAIVCGSNVSIAKVGKDD